MGSAFSKHKKTEHSELVKRLAALGGSSNELANTVLALMVGASVELSLGLYIRPHLTCRTLICDASCSALTNIVTKFVGSEHHEDILRTTRDVEAKASLDGYIYEALSARLSLLAILMLRLSSLGLDPPFEGIYRTSSFFVTES